MDMQLLIEYAWVLVILIGLEGLLAADNALILAIMVKHLPEKQRQKALFYGLIGAFVLRFASLFMISFLVDVWQLQAFGAAYLLFIMGKHFYNKWFQKEKVKRSEGKRSGFWLTVLKVELADLAFAVDSILAALALAISLPPISSFTIGGLNGGQFIVILAGGMIGVIIMRFAANIFVTLLKRRPSLETAAYIIVGWVGVKLAMLTLSHEDIQLISADFIQSTVWKTIFYVGLISIVIGSWVMSHVKQNKFKTS